MILLRLPLQLVLVMPLLRVVLWLGCVTVVFVVAVAVPPRLDIASARAVDKSRGRHHNLVEGARLS